MTLPTRVRLCLRGNGRNTSSRHAFHWVQLRSGMFTAVLHTQSAVGPVLANGQRRQPPACDVNLPARPACLLTAQTRLHSRRRTCNLSSIVMLTPCVDTLARPFCCRGGG